MSSSVTVREKAPLDALMLAMDVVDTLRHRERVLALALTEDEQDTHMIVRLKEIYAGQGIEVSDGVLVQGVKALREDRFVYTPPAPGFGRTLARLYVSRGRWGMPLAAGVGLLAAGIVAFQLFVREPQLAAIEALPADIAAAYSAVVDLTDEAGVEAEAAELRAAAERALAREDYGATRAAVAELGALEATLAVEYELRVVSRPGTASGVWRVPEDNQRAQNFYLIVEALDPDGERLTLPITNEETERVDRVSQWGVRVDEATFQRVARDKQDDGIIQDNIMGEKIRGRLEPEYRAGAGAGMITAW